MKETGSNVACRVLSWNKIEERWRCTLNLNSPCPKFGTHFESGTHLSSHVAAQWIPLGLILHTICTHWLGWEGALLTQCIQRQIAQLYVLGASKACDLESKCLLYFLRVTWPSQQPPVWLWAGFHSQARTQSLHFFFFFSKWSPKQSSLSRAWWNACSLPWTSLLSHTCRSFCDLANEQAHMWESVPHSETFPDGHVLLGGLPVCSTSPWLRKSLGSALFTVGGAGSHQGPPSCGSQYSGDSRRKAPWRKT